MSGHSGIGTYLNGLIEGLSKIDAENQYVLVTNEDRTLPLPVNFKFKKIEGRVFSLRSQFEMHSIVKEEKLDLLHIPHFYSFFLCPCAMVTTIHDLILSLFPEETSLFKRIYYNFMIKYSLNKARKIIAVSQNTKKDIVALFHIPQEKIKVVYEGVEEDFYPMRDEHSLNLVKEKYGINAPFLFYVGLKKPHKNLKRLLEAFRILKSQGRREKLVLAGKEDHRYPLENVAKEMGLEGEIIFTGYVSKNELVMLYNASEIFIFPSLYEGFGLPILEAMACGKPVITSNCSSIPEVAGDSALFVDPYNVMEIAGAIGRVLDNEQLKKNLSEKALQRPKIFSWTKCAYETLGVYRSCVNQ